MSEFKYSPDEVEELGFISKEKLLQYVTEEQIYELVFKFQPVEFEYVTSPLREDSSPGCWFEVDPTNGKLQFRDFGDGDRPLDCFDVVKKYYGISNFYKTLAFIKTALIDGKGVKHDIKTHVAAPKRNPLRKSRVKILVKTRPFKAQDRKFWQPYGITKLQLIEDKVFPISLVKLLNTKKGDVSFNIKSIGYAYTEFENGMKKIYQPYSKDYKFLTNCTENAVGGISKLPPYGRMLIITKSYKDYRVLRNQGLNTIWFQNEGMKPSIEIILNLVERFQEIIVFFDNDRAGLEASQKIVTSINEHSPSKARKLCLDVSYLKEDITDPSDLVKGKGITALNEFLKFQRIL